MNAFLLLLTLLLAGTLSAQSSGPGLVLAGGRGAGAGKHIVLVSGDEEYRSEESLPMLARVLSRRHGFQCTVLFALNWQSGEIDPNTAHNTRRRRLALTSSAKG
jgi:hypothetical protein